MLRAEYGDAGAALIKDSGLMDNPMRLVINSKWDDLVDGETCHASTAMTTHAADRAASGVDR
jgi:hypothetical protein